MDWPGRAGLGLLGTGGGTFPNALPADYDRRDISVYLQHNILALNLLQISENCYIYTLNAVPGHPSRGPHYSGSCVRAMAVVSNLPQNL